MRNRRMLRLTNRPYPSMSVPTFHTKRGRERTTNMKDPRENFLSCQSTEEGESGPEGAEVLSGHAEDEEVRVRGEVLDCCEAEESAGLASRGAALVLQDLAVCTTHLTTSSSSGSTLSATPTAPSRTHSKTVPRLHQLPRPQN